MMERAARPYNLKLVFKRRPRPPAAPAFVLVGANDGRGLKKITLRASQFYIQRRRGNKRLSRVSRGNSLWSRISIFKKGGHTYLPRGDRAAHGEAVAISRNCFSENGDRRNLLSKLV